ncbi:MAG: hypothetical protein D6782_08055 [Alphaproteobacteria bacterium]|nr:MAG: hypothetical protein D6782_08055 [Alphaproteobacteria bacterium]
MEILPNSLATSTNGAIASSTRLAEDFNTFLKLLTTQLQQQDPLDPLDSNQFTEQLVQFTSVEQQIQQNKNLENLVSLLTAQRDSNAVAFLGKEVMVESGTALHDGTGARWLYELKANAASTKLTITTESGTKVLETDGQTGIGLHPFAWDGKDQFGNPLPAGTYVLKVEAASANGSAVASTVFQREVVREIERSGGEQNLVIGGLLFPTSAVVAVREPTNAP